MPFISIHYPSIFFLPKDNRKQNIPERNYSQSNRTYSCSVKCSPTHFILFWFTVDIASMKEHISNQTLLVHKPYDVELFGGEQIRPKMKNSFNKRPIWDPRDNAVLLKTRNFLDHLQLKNSCCWVCYTILIGQGSAQTDPQNWLRKAKRPSQGWLALLSFSF